MATFKQHLEDTGRSLNTVKAYLHDLKAFALWLQETYGEDSFQPDVITQRDMVQYRSYLQTVLRRKPASVNRAIKSVYVSCEWARRNGWIAGNPAEDIPMVQQVPAPQKALDRLDTNRLLREVHKEGLKRDVAIVELLLGVSSRNGNYRTLRDSRVLRQHGLPWLWV